MQFNRLFSLYTNSHHSVFLDVMAGCLITARPRLCIVGDHSHYHAGSWAVITTLRTVAKKKGWKVVREGREYDALVVNGEGSMHDGSNQFHRKMKLLQQAVEAGKPAFLVNSVWHNNPHDYDALLPMLTGITVREVLSQRSLRNYHGVDAQVIPDASFFCPIDGRVRSYDYAGAPIVTDFFLEHKNINQKKHVFGRLDKLFPDAEPIPFLEWSWSKIVNSMKSASYLVTGRHHAVYAALLAGIPFVASEGNTPKIRGIVESAGADILIAKSPRDIPDLLAANLSRQDQYRKVRQWIETHDIAEIIPPVEIIS